MFKKIQLYSSLCKAENEPKTRSSIAHYSPNFVTSFLNRLQMDEMQYTE